MKKAVEVESKFQGAQVRTLSRRTDEPEASGRMSLKDLTEVVASIVDARLTESKTPVLPDGWDPRATLTGINLGDLADVISKVVKAHVDALDFVQWNVPADYYHWLELETFTGSLEEYSVFRRSLKLCLKREKFQDSREKAIFLFKHLDGAPKDLVGHLVETLAPESFRIMMKTLDRMYGCELDHDRLRIGKLYKLPKLSKLTRDGLLDMITALEAAMPALLRREPTDTLAEHGEKLGTLLSLIPQVDGDLFFLYCRGEDKIPNLKGFLDYLYFKFDIRRYTFHLEPTHRAPRSKEKEVSPKDSLPNKTRRGGF